MKPFFTPLFQRQFASLQNNMEQKEKGIFIRDENIKCTTVRPIIYYSVLFHNDFTNFRMSY